jgi:hypothetical protein
MGRSSNDDRSDSLNPNNDAYWASESNRSNQIGDNDDDDAPRFYADPGAELARRLAQEFSRYPMAVVPTEYGFAILTFSGKARFASFHARTGTGMQSPHPNQIAVSVFLAHQRWIEEECGQGIAYARIWGPNMHSLPKVTWYEEGQDAARYNLWDTTLRAQAHAFEAKLEQQDYRDSEYLGEFAEEVDFDANTPYKL